MAARLREGARLTRRALGGFLSGAKSCSGEKKKELFQLTLKQQQQQVDWPIFSSSFARPVVAASAGYTTTSSQPGGAPPRFAAWIAAAFVSGVGAGSALTYTQTSHQFDSWRGSEAQPGGVNPNKSVGHSGSTEDAEEREGSAHHHSAAALAPPEIEGHPRTRVVGTRDKQTRKADEGETAEPKVGDNDGSTLSEEPRETERGRQIWFGFKSIPQKSGLDKPGIGQHYALKHKLGEGSFGATFLAEDLNTGKEVAVKILPKSMISCADSIEDVDREVEIMRQLSGHENVVTFFDAFEDEHQVCIIMEVCKGGELFDAVQERKGKYTEKEAADTIRQILKVIAHCHLNGIVYCDVKPENFLYLDKDHKVLKAIDFGLSRHFTPLGRALRKPRGTAYYVAPEVMRFEYGPEADMWSVGVIAYLLLSGKVPFHGDTETEILQQVMTGKKIDFESGPWERVSHQAKDFLKKILERDVGLRHTAVQALSHPWLRGEASGEFEIDAAAVSSLHAFSKYGRMRKLALRAIAGVIADSGLIEDLRLQFQTMDENDNNLISTSELQAALKKTTWKHTDHEIKELLESIHCYTYGPFRNQSTGAKIDYHEFLAATMSVRQLEKHIQDKEHWKNVLRKAFNFFDKDGDGLISSDDLRKCLSSDRGNVDSLVEECMEEADLTHSGSINFESFVRLLHIHDPSSRSRYGYVKTPSSAN